MSVKLVTEYIAEVVLPDAAGDSDDILVVESNRKIANNLTMVGDLLRLHAADLAKAGKALSPQDAALLLSEVGSRIETVGRYHQLLGQSGEAGAVKLRPYLYEIAQAAIGSMAVRNVSLICGPGAACEISAHQALPVGVLVGEAITNAVKYAHPTGIAGRIDLICEARPMGAVLILITDDGVGFPEGFDAVRGGGLGLRVMRAIAARLGARLSFESSEIGLTVRLLLPPGPLKAANGLV